MYAAVVSSSSPCQTTSVVEDITYLSNQVCTVKHFHLFSIITWTFSSLLNVLLLFFVDEICCPDPSEQRVSVGLGDSCCGGSPYLSGAGQICCEGRLYDGYSSQCCGGELVPEEMMCCGDADKGKAHDPGTGELSETYLNLLFDLYILWCI